jgi:hypothetical protein
VINPFGNDGWEIVFSTTPDGTRLNTGGVLGTLAHEYAHAVERVAILAGFSPGDRDLVLRVSDPSDFAYDSRYGGNAARKENPAHRTANIVRREWHVANGGSLNTFRPRTEGEGGQRLTNPYGGHHFSN